MGLGDKIKVKTGLLYDLVNDIINREVIFYDGFLQEQCCHLLWPQVYPHEDMEL